ncbi:hypothetical protein K437DRAFT_130657 [Tilletiaria anomala UBC 951]|uniref:Uncharacterized protein n=1 Tax=Tilletiaria anomala (strain ATCC 24038 / CBS 436.72 / UBC 951) TaxID=1037660 RepID=A0A066VWL8_TILAU|nr:uncharacterized protein K437DRAFT_130657 [Tilletiaria anomala UBC 951]KDN44693.1 hypothetical protein K437DRAFT_130657 [Tilletiaria anomala UBC 951]
MAEPYIEPHTPLAEYLKEYHHQRGGSGGSAAAVGASSRSSFRKEKGGKMTRGMLGTAFGAGRKVSSSRHQPSSSRSSSVSSSTGSASTGTGAGGAMAYDNAVSSLPSSSAAATQPPGTHSFRCKPIHHTHASSVSRSGDCGNLLRSASATTLEEELGAAAAAEAEVHAAWSEHTLSSSSLASAPSGTSISSQQQELQGLGLRSTSAEVTSPSQPVYVVDQNKDVPPSPLPQHEAPFPTSATQSSTTNILASLPPGSSPRPTPSIPDPNTTASDTSESSEAERDDLHGGDDIENEQGRHRARAWAWDLSAKMPAPPPRPLSVASSKSTRPIGGAASTYADADKQSIMSASGVAVPTIGRKGTTVSLHQSPTFASKGSAGAIATISASALARCSVVSASSSVRSSGQWGDVPSSSNPSSSRVLDFGFGGMEEGEQAWATLSKDRALAAGAASAGAGAGGATAANKRVKPELSARSRGMMPSPKLLDESALSFETITGIGGRSGGDELRKRMSPRASVNTSASRSRSPAREFRSSGVGSLQWRKLLFRC